MRRLTVVLIALAVLLPLGLFAAASLPPVLRWAVGLASGAAVDVRASRLAGNLFTGVRGEDATVTMPGLRVRAERLEARYSIAGLLAGELRLDARVVGGDVRIDPAAFPPAGPQGGQAGPRVVLQGLELERSSVRLAGRFLDLPDARATVLQQTRRDDGGTLRVAVRTPDGAGTATIGYRLPFEPAGDFVLDVNARLDARIARHWYEGIEGGTVTGRYSIGSRLIEGSGEISGGVVRPLPGIVVSGVEGSFRHARDGVIATELRGRALGGPVRARGRVDTVGQRWTVEDARLEPLVAGALGYLAPGVDGSGRLAIAVRGEGWDRLELRGTASADGSVAGLPVEGLAGSLVFREPGGLEVRAGGQTRLAGDPVRVEGTVRAAGPALEVKATAAGTVLGSPLSLDIGVEGVDGRTRIEGRGRVLGGDLRAALAVLEDGRLDGSGRAAGLGIPGLGGQFDANLEIGGRGGAIELGALVTRGELSLPGLRRTDWRGRVDLRQGPDGALVGTAAIGELRVAGGLLEGSLVARGLELQSGGVADVEARYDLRPGSQGVGGRLGTRGVTAGPAELQPLAGPFTVRWTPALLATWDPAGAAVRLDASRVDATLDGLRASAFGEALSFEGRASYALDAGTVTGEVVGTGELGRLRAVGRGTAVDLDGDLRYQELRAGIDGTLTLRPFGVDLRARLAGGGPGSLTGAASLGPAGLSLDLLSGPTNRRVQVRLVDGRLEGGGTLELAALDVLLPLDARGRLSGVAEVAVAGPGGTARVVGAYGDLPFDARAVLTDGRVTVDGSLTGGILGDLRAAGTLLPALDARATFDGLTADIGGSLDDLRFQLRGPLPGRPELSGAGLDLGRPPVRLDGRLRGGVVRAAGSVGKLEIPSLEFRDGILGARVGGELTGSYQGEPFGLTGLSGRVTLAGSTVAADLNAAGATGTVGGIPVVAEGLIVAGRATPAGAVEAEVRAARASFRREDLRARALGLNGVVRIDDERLTLDAASQLEGSFRNEPFGGRVEGRLSIATGAPAASVLWGGSLDAGLAGPGWSLRADGPWRSIRLAGSAPAELLGRLAGTDLPGFARGTVRLEGSARLPGPALDVGFETSLGSGLSALRTTGRARAVPGRFDVEARLADTAGGRANVVVASDRPWRAQSRALDVSGLIGTAARLTADLTIAGTSLAGTATGDVAGLPISARWLEDGRFEGSLGGPVPLALSAARWRFPLDVSPVEVRSAPGGPASLDVRATLNLTDDPSVSGTVGFGPVRLGTGPLSVELARTTATLEAAVEGGGPVVSLTAGEGQLMLRDGSWDGTLDLAYQALGARGTAELRLSGPAGSPRVGLDSTGPATLAVRGDMETLSVSGTLDLSGMRSSLPPELRGATTPGRVRVAAGVGLTPSFRASGTLGLEGAIVDGLPATAELRASLDTRASPPAWQLAGSVGVGASRTTVQAGPDGLVARDLDLDLRLLRVVGLKAAGRITGSADLPGYDLDRGRAGLRLAGVRVAGAEADGTVELLERVVTVDLAGSAPGEIKLGLVGRVLPVADASLRVDDLSGRLTGRILTSAEAGDLAGTGERDARLELSGSLGKRPASALLTVRGTAFDLEASYAGALATLDGKLDGLSPAGRGRIELPDLTAITDLKGSLAGDLELRGPRLIARNLAGRVAGFSVGGDAAFEDGRLELRRVVARGDGIAARLDGLVLPELDLRVSALSTIASAPGRLSGTVGGTLARPVVRLSGELGTASVGVVAPGTRVDASLEGDEFRLVLAGDRLRGRVDGTTASIREVEVEVDAPVVAGDTRIAVEGLLAWSVQDGFDGALAAAGTLLDAPFKALIEGDVQLGASLDWRGGRLVATLPRNPGARLDGSLELDRLDLGALWGRPGRLALDGSGTLAGGWTEPEIRFAGRLDDADDQGLDASLNGVLAGGTADATLAGPRVDLSASLDAGRWTAGGTVRELRLDGLLPASTRGQLQVSAGIAASGDGRRLELRATDVQARGRIAPVGNLSVTGKLAYDGASVETDLMVAALNGRLTALGRLGRPGDSLRLRAADLSLEAFGASGLASADLLASGSILDPATSGSVQVRGLAPLGQDAWSANLDATLSGRASSLDARAGLVLGGSSQGRLMVDVERLGRPDAIAAVEGRGQLEGIGFDASLRGAWPRLAGRLEVRTDRVPPAALPLRLVGSGDGRYELSAGELARGVASLEPYGPGPLDLRVAGRLDLNAELSRLVENASGVVTGLAELSGSLRAPELSASGSAGGLSYAGVTAPAMRLEGGVGVAGASVSAVFQGGTASWDGSRVTVEGLAVRSGALVAVVGAGGRLGGAGGPDLALSATTTGPVAARLTGRYAAGGLTLELARADLPGGLTAAGRAAGGPDAPWAGSLTVRGLPGAGPNGVVVENAGALELRLSGPFREPRLSGGGIALGARVRLDAGLAPLAATLTLQDGPAITDVLASGVLKLEDGRLGGSARYATGRLTADLTATGTLETPAMSAEVRSGRGRARVQASVGPDGPGGRVELSDGRAGGALVYERGRLTGRVPGLDLEALALEGFGGTIALAADLTPRPGLGSLGVEGRLELVWSDLRTPVTAPGLGWPVDGDGRVAYESRAGQAGAENLVLDYKGTPGRVEAVVDQDGEGWRGSADFDLAGAGGRGSVSGTVSLGHDGVRGQAALKDLAVRFGDVDAVATGTVELGGASFSAQGTAQALGGRLALQGQGGLSDLFPALARVTGVEPGLLGYAFRAVLDGVRFEDIAPLRAIAPQATGRISGVAQVSDAVTTFQLTAPELSLPGDAPDAPLRLPLRLQGTLAGPSVRFSGNVGDSIVSGAVTGNDATGRLELRRAPLHALVGAVAGPLPAGTRAFVSGLARFDLPLARPLDGSVRVALERIDVEGGGDRLTGSGTLLYARGGLEIDSLRLDGAGSWRANGRYAPGAVDLRVELRETAFTPFLRLVPALGGLDPAASGSVDLRLSGQYGRPDVRLAIANLSARAAGIELRADNLEATLEDERLSLRGMLVGSGAVSGRLMTTITAGVPSVVPPRFEDLRVSATGSLRVRPVGTIDDVSLGLSGSSGSVRLALTGRRGGPIKLEGTVSPRLDLRLSATDLALSSPELLIRDGLVSGNLRIQGDPAGFLDVSGTTKVQRLALASAPGAAEAATGRAEAGPAAPANSGPAPSVGAAGARGGRNPLLERIRFDSVTISAPANVRVQESFVAAEVGGELVLTGTAAAPALSGSIAALSRGAASPDGENRGTLSLGPNSYTIQDAAASFNPAEGVYPVVTARAVTRVRTQLERTGAGGLSTATVVVTLDATVRFVRDPGGERRLRLETRLSSQVLDAGFREPTEQELYGLVALGSATQGLTVEGLGQGALNTALGVFVLGELSRAFTAATGISLQISTNLLDLTEADRTISAAFTFGGYLSRQLYLEYSVNTLGGSSVNLTATTEDGRFTFRFSSPIQINLGGGTNPLLSGFAPELSASYNISSLTSVTTALQFGTGLRFKLGFSLRF